MEKMSLFDGTVDGSDPGSEEGSPSAFCNLDDAWVTAPNFKMMPHFRNFHVAINLMRTTRRFQNLQQQNVPFFTFPTKKVASYYY
jgi:hypothetical protein